MTPRHLTPYQRRLELERLGQSEIALLRTTVQFGQSAEQRAKALARLQELGVDPTRPEAK